VAPNITTPKTEQVYNVTEGDNITCTATGYPVPDIVWLNNDESVVDNNRLVTGSVASGYTDDDSYNISSVSGSMIVRRNNDDGVILKPCINIIIEYKLLYIYCYVHIQ